MLCVISTAQRHTYFSSARDISYFSFSLELCGLSPSPNSEAGPFVFVSTLMSSSESEVSCLSSKFCLFFSGHSNDWAHILVFCFVLLPTAGSPFDVSAAALQMSLEMQNVISLHAGSSTVNRVMIHTEFTSYHFYCMPGKTGLSGCKAVMKYFFGSKLAWGGMEEFAVATTSMGEGGWSIVFHIQIYIHVPPNIFSPRNASH